MSSYIFYRLELSWLIWCLQRFEIKSTSSGRQPQKHISEICHQYYLNFLLKSCGAIWKDLYEDLKYGRQPQNKLNPDLDLSSEEQTKVYRGLEWMQPSTEDEIKL